VSTNSTHTAAEADANRDAVLAALLERLIDDSRHGRSPDLEAMIAKHPDLVDELRSLWATAMVAEEFGSMADDAELAGEPTAARAAGQRNSVPLPERIGDYEVVEEIGRGGMGVVFKARQFSLDRVVALKMILQGHTASETDVARFRAEAESAARINHPHIVPVYEVGDFEGQPYFSMKYVEGTTLSKRLAEGPLPSREAAALLVPVCRAVAEAHRHGLMHRDLKPSNILIDEAGRPYITDFGLAKRLPAAEKPDEAHKSLTHSGAILGTPGYMAPEQAAGGRGEITEATDVYGLGAILYAMLTGRAPFQTDSPVDTVLMVLEQDPLPPRLLNQRADADLEMIALKCLQKPTDLRYDSADALAADLQAYLDNEPISARSGKFSQVVSRAFRETHHAGVLENWGLLWMWHSLVLLVICVITNGFQWAGITSRWPYVGLWVFALGLWAAIFWGLRRRSGPTTFVERQIAHVWAGSVICNSLLFGVEALLSLPVLTLSPVLGVVSGMVFLVKAGILSGKFYVQSVILFLTAPVMAVIPQTGLPNVSISLFGIVSAACFFIPGLKYYRQRAEADRLDQ